MEISQYRAMWVLVMFDLPVQTKKQRKAATRFRKNLLEDGFWMLQFSVYARPCPTQENATTHFDRVKRWLPAAGQVRLIEFTDRQFARMQIFDQGKRGQLEQAPGQLRLFQ